MLVAVRADPGLPVLLIPESDAGDRLAPCDCAAEFRMNWIHVGTVSRRHEADLLKRKA